MKLSRETKVASSLLAKAFIAARSGDEEKAGAYMMAACRTDALDPVMHGIAASMGIDEADYDDDEMEAGGCENGECCASDEDDYDDIEAADEDEDEDDAEEVEFGEVEFDEEEDEDAEDTEDGEAEKKSVGVAASAEKPSKVAVPASCYRLARARY